jgi:hypothetical protein
MKIDLHCHTRKVKKGDPATREVTPEVFAEKIKNADVRIVAITNHNLFDYEQYKLFKETVKEYCDVWPGIEIDTFGDYTKKGKPKLFHLIVVANPACAEKFKEKVDSLLQGFDVNKDSKHIRDVCKAFKQIDVLYIPHYLGKTPAISDDDLELLKLLVPDNNKVFTETTESSIGVLVNNDFRALVGSDVRDWASYEDSLFSDLRLPVSSYEQFCFLAKRDNAVIDTLLNQKKSSQYTAQPHSSVKFKLKLFEDVNIIFGQKGTGKSEILNSLASNLADEGLRCVKYVGSQKEDGFKRLLSKNGMVADCELLGAKRCGEEFAFIREWKDPNITSFSLYSKWYNTRNNNANKKSMKITEAVNLVMPDGEELKIVKDDRKLFIDVLKKYEQISVERYLKDDDFRKLEALLQKLGDGIYSEVLNAFDYAKTVELTNYSVDKIKELADKKTDTVSKPSSTGFLEYAQVHLELKKSADNILKELNTKAFFQDSALGELEGKGQVYIRSLYRMLCPESRTQEFSSGINNLKLIKAKIEEISKDYYKADIASQISTLVELLTDNSVSSVADFIGLSKYVVDDLGESYEPWVKVNRVMRKVKCSMLLPQKQKAHIFALGAVNTFAKRSSRCKGIQWTIFDCKY